MISTHYRFTVLTSLSLFVLSQYMAASPLDIEGMVPRNPKPSASHIIEVTHQNGRWITGADGGILSHSVDGEDWSSVALPYQKGIPAIIYWKGWYFAAGVDSRTLMRSLDLVNWLEEHPANYPFNPHGFMIHDNKLFAVGWSSGLSYTEDSINWVNVDVHGEERMNGIASDGSRLVIVGGDGLIYSSEDSVEWTLRQDSIPGLEGLDDDFIFVTWLEDQFVAGGKQGLLMTSPDGISWTLVDWGGEDWLNAVFFIDGSYYFTGRQGKLHKTSDFLNWTEVSTGITSTIQDIYSSGTDYLAAGRNGYVAFSEDGETWKLTGVGTREYMFELEYGAEVFVAASGDGGIWKSNDSEGWVQVHEVSDGRRVTGLVFNGTQFTGISSNGILLTSNDGESWVEGPGLVGSPSRMRLIDDTYWVVGEDGLIAHSTDLLSWTTMTAGPDDLRDITFGNGVHVAVGRKGTLYYSANRTDWTKYETSVTTDLKTVAFANETFVVLGRSSILLTSPDGMEWTSHGNPGYTPFDGHRLEVIDGEFVVVGYLGNSGTSTDGISWSLSYGRFSQTLFDIVCAAERTVAVGTFGTIASTPFVLSGGYEEWASVRFSLAEQFDPKKSGLDADPDMDGRSNAFEFFSNTPPLVFDDGPPYSVFLIEEDGIYYQGFEIVRRTELAGAELQFWRTANLAEWDGLIDEQIQLISQTPLDEESDLLRYRLTEPLANARSQIMTMSVKIEE